jgi:hypothetical protein
LHSQFYSVVWNDTQECLGRGIPKWLSTSLDEFFTPLFLISSSSKCREFTELSISHGLELLPFIHSVRFLFLQNLLYPFFKSVSGCSFGSLPLCSSLSGPFGLWIILNSYNVRKQSQLCKFCDHFERNIFPHPILIVWPLILSLLVFPLYCS